MSRPPDIAVEVLSPGQSRTEMRAKVDIYLSFGIRSVWVIDLDRESVDVYEDGARSTVAGPDPITSSMLPAFSLTVEKLLEEVDR